jgi:hypothetical protein
MPPRAVFEKGCFKILPEGYLILKKDNPFVIRAKDGSKLTTFGYAHMPAMITK